MKIVDLNPTHMFSRSIMKRHFLDRKRFRRFIHTLPSISQRSRSSGGVTRGAPVRTASPGAGRGRAPGGRRRSSAAAGARRGLAPWGAELQGPAGSARGLPLAGGGAGGSTAPCVRTRTSGTIQPSGPCRKRETAI